MGGVPCEKTEGNFNALIRERVHGECNARQIKPVTLPTKKLYFVDVYHFKEKPILFPTVFR